MKVLVEVNLKEIQEEIQDEIQEEVEEGGKEVAEV